MDFPQAAQAIVSASWQISDPLSRSFSAALESARKRSAGGLWDVPELSRPIAYADLRALSVHTALVLSHLTPEARPNDLYSDRWGAALARTYDLLAKGAGYQGQTIGSERDASKDNPTAFVAIEIVALIVGALVAAATVGFVIYEIAQVVDRELARQPANDELVRLHSEAEKIVSDHLDAEKAAGHPIPWSPSELDALDRLEKQQATIIHGLLPPPDDSATKPVDMTTVALATLALGAGAVFAYRKGWI